MHTLEILEKMKKIPFGLKAFSRIICLKAPYFSTIKPEFLRLEPGYGEARIEKRRAVTNHLGTVHAIATANLCEFVAGMTVEVSIPKTHRWIPSSMKIDYLKKADSDLIAKTMIPITVWPDAGTITVHVDVYDRKNTKVVQADIEMHVSLKKTS
jgi:acyl-coenzyme A thioesterase PaaI-like protein